MSLTWNWGCVRVCIRHGAGAVSRANFVKRRRDFLCWRLFRSLESCCLCAMRMKLLAYHT
ncbi:hypothetical protein HBI56_061720 [Parastagonospora nodorum]|nr:hypothetical protein HBH52_173040 [Parastagonospora nodorum]KAH4036136.1 hypothetical protein HBI09_083170 [Parastagonospora nodorum]KAH4064510.1 hypothetical protein HBH50_171930 [Parastagonospora nodorum]KAH4083692.1 hypothetical protein HBH48_169540 [Parastagonospora nodorum]KAH4118963.1 hypothetical protein HBH47_131280 [Parastagonospora nodorum]